MTIILEGFDSFLKRFMNYINWQIKISLSHFHFIFKFPS